MNVRSASFAGLLHLLCCTAVCAAADSGAASCPPGTKLEGVFQIRHVRVESPFSFLPWIRSAMESAQHDLSNMEGKPYRDADVRAGADELKRRNFLPESEGQRVRISLITTAVENCADDKVDVVYTNLSTQIAPVLSGTLESRRKEASAPEHVAGADATSNRFRLLPSVGYDRAEHLFPGGRAEYLAGTDTAGVPIDSAAIEGQGSDTMRRFSAALAGSRDWESSTLAHAEWQLDYLNTSEPADPGRLQQNRGALYLAAMTRPLSKWQLPVRFGGMFEGGELRSNFATSTLSSDSEDNSGYASGKFYLGTTARLPRNVFSASYGIEIGSSGDHGADWIKHIGDIGHDLSILVADHRPLAIESRLGAGLLQVPGTVPVAARFFGGSREVPFIPGDSWTIRSNPVIRSIPANELFRTDNGPGATRFIAYNLTMGIPVWQRPVVPTELSNDPSFTRKLCGAIKSATNVLQVEYEAADPSFKRAAARLGEVRAALGDLNADVEKAQAQAQPGNPRGFKDLFTNCLKAIKTADRRARNAAQAKGGAQLGDLVALLNVTLESDEGSECEPAPQATPGAAPEAADDGEDESESQLLKVHAACAEELNGKLHDDGIARRSAALEAIRLDMEQLVGAIDKRAAAAKAADEMAYVKQTLDTMVHEWNLVAVSPVVMFDVAHIEPASSHLGTRYGIGGGLRITLVSYFDLTVGYLANPTRTAAEPPGAAYFSMQFKDLFR